MIGLNIIDFRYITANSKTYPTPLTSTFNILKRNLFYQNHQLRTKI